MDQPIRPIAQTWDKVAENYRPEFQEAERQLAGEIAGLLESLGVAPGARLLELGAGSGHLSAVLAQKGFQVTLLDFSVAALEKARACFKQHGLSGRFVEGDLTRLPAGLGEFEVVWNSGVMEHFDDESLRSAFDSVRAVSAAHYLFIVPNPDSFPYLLFRYQSMSRGEWMWGWEALRRDYAAILAAAGFSVAPPAYLGAKFAESQLCAALGTTEWPLERLIQSGVVARHECALVAYPATRAGEPVTPPRPADQPQGVTAYQTEIFDLRAQLRRWQEGGRLVEHQTRSLSAGVEANQKVLAQAQERLQGLEGQLRALAKTKPYRLAHFLRRLERDGLKGTWQERKEFAAWLLRRLTGRQVPDARQKNPLLELGRATPSVSHEQGNNAAAVRAGSYRADLESILQAHAGKPIMVSRPVYDWKLPLLQRPQHLARELTAEGFLYFFCTPNLRERVEGFCQVHPGCYVTDQFPLLEELSPRITHLYAGDLKCDLTYVRQRRQAGDLILYEFIDELHPTLCGAIPAEAQQRHDTLLADSDVVCIVSADALLRRVQAHRARNTALVTNGVEVEHFAAAGDSAAAPAELRPLLAKGKPILGYFGALASWFDYGLVEGVARERPQYEWLLVGWDFDGSLDKSGVRQLPNVTVVGPVDYARLPQYARHFDVATIPFALNPITQSTSPIKLFEYMALGKPIVTTNLPECRKYQSPRIATSPAEFVRLLDEAVQAPPSPAERDRWRQEAQANSWRAKAQAIAGLLRMNLSQGSNPLLDEVQQEIIGCYRQDNPAAPSYYESAYREAERKYWLPALNWIDELPPVESVADIGAAYGSLLLYSIKRFNPARRLAVDPVQILSPTLIQRHQIRYVRRDVERDELADLGLYDLVLFTEVLEHLNFHPVPTLRKLRNLVKPGGHLVLSTPDASQWGRITQFYQRLDDMPVYQGQSNAWIDSHIWQYSAQEAERVFAQAGWQVVRFAYAPGNGARHLCYLLRPDPGQSQLAPADGPGALIAPTNSLEWWEDYFRNHWEQNHGRDQTRHFMTRLLESLPAKWVATLARPGTTILDWGCAFGDGVDILQRRFPGAVVHGYDFSPQAIQTAGKYYPQHQFFHPGKPGLQPQYDAVVCSNCLEHFADPLPVLAAQLGLSRSLHLVLVPYAEYNRTPAHEVTLTQESFPIRLGGFRRVSVTIIEVDPTYWAGRQMLVVYRKETRPWTRWLTPWRRGTRTSN